MKTADVKIKNIEKKILYSLLKDSRKKFSEIAEECSVSISTVKNRYNEMKKNGIIKNSTLIVDASKLGFEGHLSLFANVKSNEIEEFRKYVDNISGATSYPVELNENYNIHVLFPIKNIREIEKRRDQILNHPSVINLRANLWTEIIVLPENISEIQS